MKHQQLLLVHYQHKLSVFTIGCGKKKKKPATAEKPAPASAKAKIENQDVAYVAEGPKLLGKSNVKHELSKKHITEGEKAPPEGAEEKNCSKSSFQATLPQKGQVDSDQALKSKPTTCIPDNEIVNTEQTPFENDINAAHVHERPKELKSKPGHKETAYRLSVLRITRRRKLMNTTRISRCLPAMAKSGPQTVVPPPPPPTGGAGQIYENI
ncbi:unnamed protein product, partial [Mesorhabditis belari]|uniref:Uncharacterized protein n=1 Tax=Mesorhabditis belari TaxID=2138241 RepID=A0AAF3FG55_9BILA